MFEDFLTIPDAPNYEINSQFICRNKKTGYILKLQKDKRGKTCYSMHRPDGKSYHRSPKFLRRVALATANQKSSFEPIPSLDCRYEINERGVVRNVRTKQVLALTGHGKCVALRVNGTYVSRCVTDLLWEVHGRIIKRRFRPQPCSAENPRGKYFFKNMRDCARFLAPKVFFVVGTVYGYLCKRTESIGKWKITYLDEFPAEVE